MHENPFYDAEPKLKRELKCIDQQPRIMFYHICDSMQGPVFVQRMNKRTITSTVWNIQYGYSSFILFRVENTAQRMN